MDVARVVAREVRVAGSIPVSRSKRFKPLRSVIRKGFVTTTEYDRLLSLA